MNTPHSPSLQVCELFKSIQGESSFAGMPCLFIRLTGCNLRCSYCDTQYSYDGGFSFTVDEIVKKVSNSSVKLVEITGGEPLLQDGTVTLVDKLIDCGRKVLIETNGSLEIKDVNREAIIIMDIKGPSSKMASKMNFLNIKHLKPFDEVKLLIADRADYEWACETMRKYSLTEICTVLISPVHSQIPLETVSNWILEDSLNVRLNIQLHKYIFADSNKERKIGF